MICGHLGDQPRGASKTSSQLYLGRAGDHEVSKIVKN